MDNSQIPTPNSTPTRLLLTSTPQILQTVDQPCAMVPLRIPLDRIKPEMDSALKELHAVMERQQVIPTGPFYTHHLRVPDTEFELEVCMPTARSLQAEGRVQPWFWPAMTVARVTYQGDYANLPAAWGEFMGWLREHNHKPDTTAIYEIYHVTPRDSEDPSQWITELNCGLIMPGM